MQTEQDQLLFFYWLFIYFLYLAVWVGNVWMTTWHSLQPQTTNHKGFTEREGVSSGSGVFQLFEVLLQTDGASFIFLLQHNLVCKLLLSKWTDLRSSICLRLQSRVQSDWFPALTGPPDPNLGRCIWRRAP